MAPINQAAGMASSLAGMPLPMLQQLLKQLPPNSPQAQALLQMIAAKAGQYGGGIQALAGEKQSTVDLPLPKLEMLLTPSDMAPLVQYGSPGSTFPPSAPPAMQGPAMNRFGMTPPQAATSRVPGMYRPPGAGGADMPGRHIPRTMMPQGAVKALSFERGRLPQPPSGIEQLSRGIPNFMGPLERMRQPDMSYGPARGMGAPGQMNRPGVQLSPGRGVGLTEGRSLPNVPRPVPPAYTPPRRMGGGLNRGRLPPNVEAALSAMEQERARARVLPLNPVSEPPTPMGGGITEALTPEMQAMGSRSYGGLAAQADELQGYRDQLMALQQNRTPRWADAALAAGSAMMASQSPYPFTQLGEGGIAALGAVRARRGEDIEALKTAYEMQRGQLADRLALAELEQRGDIAAAEALNNAKRTRAYVAMTGAQSELAKAQAKDLQKADSDLERYANALMKDGDMSEAAAYKEAAANLKTSASDPLLRALASVYTGALSAAQMQMLSPDEAHQEAVGAMKGFVSGVGEIKGGPASGSAAPAPLRLNPNTGRLE